MPHTKHDIPTLNHVAMGHACLQGGWGRQGALVTPYHWGRLHPEMHEHGGEPVQHTQVLLARVKKRAHVGQAALGVPGRSGKAGHLSMQVDCLVNA